MFKNLWKKRRQMYVSALVYSFKASNTCKSEAINEKCRSDGGMHGGHLPCFARPFSCTLLLGVDET
jgi:hypothetical protein